MKLFRLLFVLMTPVLFFACSKEKSFELGNSTTAQWEFTEGSNQFKGRVDTAYIVDLGAGQKGLLLQGTSEDGTGLMAISISGINTASTGVYKTPNVTFDYAKSAGIVYENDITATNQFTIEITKVDSASITGIFSGKVKDSTGSDKVITSGKFKASIKSSGGPAPGGDGQLSFWAKNSCTAGGDITVQIANQSGTISSFSASTPANCTAAGNANFTLPAGNYTWKTFCGGDSTSGNVTVNAGICTKIEIIYPTGSAAQYSLVSSGGNCSSIQVNGTYIAGKLLRDTNNVVVQVNVTTPGSYTISTTTVNGYSFSSSGTFTTTGVKNVTLNGVGTPVAAGTNNFTVTAGTSTCNFAITAIAAPVGGTLNTWSFTQGTKTFSGTFPTGGDFGDDFFGFGKAVDMFGEIPNTDTAFDIYIQFPANATQPIPGTYTTHPDLFNSNTSDVYMYDSNTDIFYVKDFPPLPTTTPTMTIIITSYDATTKVVKGTFSGQAWNSSGNIVNITNGKFEAVVNF